MTKEECETLLYKIEFLLSSHFEIAKLLEPKIRFWNFTTCIGDVFEKENVGLSTLPHASNNNTS